MLDKLYEELYTRLVLISDWLDTGHYIKDNQQNKLFQLDQVCLAVQEGRLTQIPIITGEINAPQIVSVA